MSVTGSITYLRRKDIDTRKWDDCITASPNGLVYAYHFYLDGMCDNWDALVLDDYSAVMPLPWKKKWGIHYLPYQPFCASLGIFGKGMDSLTATEKFLAAIPRKFRYWDFPLNHGNHVPSGKFEVKIRTNYVLSLSDDYRKLSGEYRQNIKRNIRKCHDLKYTVDKGFPIKEVIRLAKLFHVNNRIYDSAYVQFEEVFNLMALKKQAVTYGIRNGAGDLLASCGFVFSHQRAYYLLVGNHPDGRTSGASHALIDAFISDHAGRRLLLDFEGSDIRNLAFFYSSFGAHTEHYPAIQYNRLPALLRFLKK
jgi:hypothetical protein